MNTRRTCCKFTINSPELLDDRAVPSSVSTVTVPFRMHASPIGGPTSPITVQVATPVTVTTPFRMHASPIGGPTSPVWVS